VEAIEDQQILERTVVRVIEKEKVRFNVSPGENLRGGNLQTWRSGNLGVSCDDSHLFFFPTGWFGGSPISGAIADSSSPL
jgi:hypothetical protein